ncbi:MAG: hypothetical protein MI919_33005 [Holophagales bacterium]|nr:hypothetical protein [Holophagales bacterium]
MPKNKDFKRLVRERMAKTGESYTAARVQLLAKRSHAGERLSEEELAEIAGLSTEAVVRATGHDWAWWLDALSSAEIRRSEHREITRHVEERFDISAWWVQSVVVGYERIVGLREIGQRREGTYDANKSKTFPVPVEVLYGAFDEDTHRRIWLPGVDWQVRTRTAPRSLRLTWPDGSHVDLWFTAKGDTKSSVQVQHRKLASKEDRALAKQAWAERFEDLKRYLAEGS